MIKRAAKFFVLGLLVIGASYVSFAAYQMQFNDVNIHFSPDLVQNFSKITPNLPTSFHEIIHQPYSYLDRGKQSFAFLSHDKKYVLKFFDTRCQRNDLLPFFWNMTKKRCIAKTKLLINGYRVAYEHDKDFAGLIYFQTGNQEALKGEKVEVTDRFGFTHTIDLSDVPFVIQHKAIPTRSVITDLLNKGDVEGVKKHLKLLRSMYLDEYQRGLFDRDHNFMYNTGFIDNQPIRIDVGRLQVQEAIKNPDVYNKDLSIIARRTDEWLKRHFPKYRDQIDFNHLD